MRSIKIRLTIYCFICILSWTCTHHEVEPLPQIFSQEETTYSVEKGVIRLKLNEKMADTLEIYCRLKQITSNNVDFNQMLSALRVTDVKRTFPHAGRFEARSRKRGLHLWYDIRFDSTLTITRASGDWASLEGVDVVEALPRLHTHQHKPILIPSSVSPSLPEDEENKMPFNDPLLPSQWHYDNRGQVADAIVKADINLFEAWKHSTGSADIVVAVVDGGIDIKHEDLIANLKINYQELYGESNKDDDDNGYVDDIYGYNFVTHKATLNKHSHGTHVAGIIGAENNNQLGGCGVAGGYGSVNSGVKLLSCQIFDYNEAGKEIGTLSVAEAIKYGADNGAIICQNSWGYEDNIPLPQSVKEAIDYFVDHAGIDELGNQVGKMKGGIVIFAAGNYNRNYCVPSSYEKVIAVAAMASDFYRAPYSCFGSWVDITAPGGSVPYKSKYHDGKSMVLSTLPDNQYGYMEGTSMACPHVSGIAALILSKFGGQGFTPDQLKERLFSNPGNIYLYNQQWIGSLGAGYVDAMSTLLDNQPPSIIKMIPNHIFPVLGEVHNLSLNEYFQDESTLSYKIRVSPSYLANATIVDDQLTIKMLRAGTAKLYITAKNQVNRSTSQAFTVSYTDSQPEIYPEPVLFPNPFKDYLMIKMPTEDKGFFHVRLINMFGVTVFQNEYTIEENLLQLDLRNLAGGVYIMESNFNGKHYSQNIIKL